MKRGIFMENRRIVVALGRNALFVLVVSENILKKIKIIYISHLD